MIKAVLFDYGGVLSEGGRRGSAKQAIADHFGFNPEDLAIDEVMVKYGRGFISTEEFFEEINKTHKSKNQINEESFLETEVQKAIEERSEQVYDFAQNLRGHGLKTGMVSNVQKIVADKLRQLGNYKDFAPIVLSYQIKTAKPELDFYEFTIKFANVKPEEIIFVDDKEECLTPAKKLGMKTVLAVSPKQIVADVKKIILEENNLKI